MKTKTLNKEAMIRNIRGLSLGDRAYCGPYGTIECYSTKYCDGARKFSVSGSIKLRNGGNWSFTKLREAICAK